MNILFDLSSTQPVHGNDFHGGGEYAKTVFTRFCELLPSGLSLEVFYNPDKNMESSILEICKTSGFTVNYCRNNFDLSQLLSTKEFDVFYCPLLYSISGLVIPKSTKFIYTIHGLRSLEYPGDRYELKYRKNSLKGIFKHIFITFFPSIWWKYRSAKSIKGNNMLFSLAENQTIITVSNHSKYAINYFFPNLDISGIKVFYSPMKNYGFDKNKTLEILKSLALEPGKYILLIGGDRPEKGAYRACRVLHKLMERQNRIPKEIKVLVLGVSNHRPYLKLTKNSDRFVFHDYVPTEDLETLYKNAFLFMFPTLNEGFGYPPLEAMKYGVLCACSANSSITEICGDAVLYFNPFDETEMGIRVLQSFDEEIRREKAIKMAERHRLINKRQEQDLDLLIHEICNHEDK